MTNGTAAASASGGSGSYTYSWNSIPVQTSATATGLSAGNYSVIIPDSNGCPFTGTITVLQDPPPAALISGDSAICIGESTQLTASGGNSYTWNTLATTPSITVNPSVTATYWVIAVSGACTDTAWVTVIVNTLPSANAGTDVTIAYGSTAQLSGSGSGSGSGSYNWSPSSGLSCTNCQNPAASPLTTTTYIVTFTDSNGCSMTDTVVVFVDETCRDIYLPNVFSPNGDGENDELQIYHNNIACISEFRIVIYDRWGEKIFQSENPSFRWDGFYGKLLYETQEMNSTVVAYRMKATFISGKTIDQRGNVSIVR